MKKEKILKEKRIAIVFRINYQLKTLLKKYLNDFEKKTGYRISMSSFIESAVKDKLMKGDLI